MFGLVVEHDKWVLSGITKTEGKSKRECPCSQLSFVFLRNGGLALVWTLDPLVPSSMN